ncbi:hypothetical protein C2E23DRAFT_810303 [Lenzites betulinus]|nr:hypothetical protein C2E23DRAFT_810303 [Lenzites betulinus]
MIAIRNVLTHVMWGVLGLVCGIDCLQVSAALGKPTRTRFLRVTSRCTFHAVGDHRYIRGPLLRLHHVYRLRIILTHLFANLVTMRKGGIHTPTLYANY